LAAVEPGVIEVTVGRSGDVETFRVQKILSLTGYRGDLSYLEELQVQVSPVTGGAAGLASSLMDVKDCLSPVTVSRDKLRSGEKNFFMVGHKSYGRLNTFLLKSGLAQLDMIFELINKT
jgi:hypothetical protein